MNGMEWNKMKWHGMNEINEMNRIIEMNWNALNARKNEHMCE